MQEVRVFGFKMIISYFQKGLFIKACQGYSLNR